MHGEEIGFGYGFWSLVLVNVGIFVMLTFSYLTPVKRREWRSYGVFAGVHRRALHRDVRVPSDGLHAYCSAGQPVSGAESLLACLGPSLDHAPRRRRVDVHPVVSNGLMLGGLLLMAAGWRRIHVAQGTLVTEGVYARMRHPQYTGLFLITIGMLVQWPTLITALTWPLLILVYYRLARRDEMEVEAQFGDAYRRHKTEVAMFIPRIWTPREPRWSER